MIEDLFWFGIRWSQGPHLNEINESNVTDKKSDISVNEITDSRICKVVNSALKSDHSTANERSTKLRDHKFEGKNISEDVLPLDLNCENVTVVISPAQNNAKRDLISIDDKDKDKVEGIIEMDIDGDDLCERQNRQSRNTLDSDNNNINIDNDNSNDNNDNDNNYNGNHSNKNNRNDVNSTNIINHHNNYHDIRIDNDIGYDIDIHNSNNNINAWDGKSFHGIELAPYKNIYKQSQRTPLYIAAWKILTSLKLGDLILYFHE